LRKESESLPARLQKKIEAAVAQALGEEPARFEHQALVLQKDTETERRVGELRVKSLEEDNTRLVAQVATLEKQLADAKQQVQDMAVGAIEGASGAKALSPINQIAMEQAKNRPQG
jgi:hypothetical protein